MTSGLGAPSTQRLRRAGAASGLQRGIEKLARTAGTGLLFAVLGVGGLVVIVLLLPLQRLARRDARDLAAQRLLHRSLALYVRFGAALRLWSVEVEGERHLRGEGGRLVLANHPTLLDVVLLIAQLPQADCVVKRAAWASPFLGPVVRAAGYLPNDPGEDVVERCAERLRAGRTLILFPEGSRSPEHALRAFHRGAAHVLLRSHCPFVPVVIRCRPAALKKGQAWYALPNERLRFQLSVGEPVPWPAFGVGELARPAAARRVTAQIEEHFRSRVSG